MPPLCAAQGAEPGGLAPRANGYTIGDVRLDSHGALHGQLVNRQGAPLIEETVLLRRPNEPPVSAQTDGQGRFTAGGLRPGLFAVETRYGDNVVRVWSIQAAPPAARHGILVVADTGQVVRGQFDSGGPVVRALASPWTLGLITAAAIGIPLANDKPDASN